MAVRERPEAVEGERARFAAELRSLRLLCGGPTYATLRRGSALLPPATLSDALGGRVTPRLDVVIAFVQGCLAFAAQRGVTVPPTSADLDRWKRRWAEMRESADHARRWKHRAGHSGGLTAVERDVLAEAVSAVGTAAEHSEAPGDVAPTGPDGAGTAPPWQLPNSVRALFGRDDDLRWLDAATGAGPAPEVGVVAPEFHPAPVAVLEGMGGVGKTTLAVAWGHRHRSAFPDGQLFADLGGYGPGRPADPARVLESFVLALGAAPHLVPGDLDGAAALFRSLCADRKILLLLDNAVDAAQVLPLLPASPGCAVIVTTRTAMTGLAVRADAQRRTVQPLRDADAIALLMRDLPGVAPDRLLPVASVCGNLPLALRLAASRMIEDPDNADLAAAIGSAVPVRPAFGREPTTGSGCATDGVGAAGRLIEALKDASDSHLDLAAVLSWSMAAGSLAESRALLLLSAAPGNAVDDYEAASLVGLPVTAARRLLYGLAARHLIERWNPDGWQMHDLIRAWGRGEALRILGSRQYRDAQRRLLGYYLWTADTADRTLLPQRGRPGLTSTLPPPLTAPRIGDAAAARAWCDAALPTLVGVLDLAREIDENRCAAELPHVMMSYLNLRKPWVTWLTMCRIGLDAAAVLDDADAGASLHIAAGIALRETRRLSEAVHEFGAARDAFRLSGNITGRVMARNNLAATYQDLGHPDRARDELLDAVAELEHGDPYHRAIVLHNLAEAELNLGEYQAALRHAGAALAAEVATGDEIGAAMTRTTLGTVRIALGQSALAQAEFLAALSVQRAGGDLLGQANTQRRLGQLLLDLGKRAEAAEHLADAVRILTDLGDPVAGSVARLLDSTR